MFEVDIDLIDFIAERWESKKMGTLEEFDKAMEAYFALEPFTVSENIWEKGSGISNRSLFIMRTATQFYLSKAFESMKIDLSDPNVMEVLEDGNIGTPGRIAKIWTGASNNDDTELLGGRFAKPVRLAKFPNENKNPKPIIKVIDLNAVCSHHFLPFSSKLKENSKVVVAYIPDEYVLGISKLPRVVRQLSQRGWLQEDLTKAIYDKISEVAGTKSVFVGLYDIVHTCEVTRGANSADGGFTSLEWGGDFKSSKLRQIVENAIR